MRGFFSRILILSTVGFATSAQAAIQFLNNVPTDIQAQVQADLQMVEGIQANQASPIHKTVFGAVDGKVYSTWFGDRIVIFGYDPDDTSGAIAYNSVGVTPRTMKVTDLFVKGSLPQIARLVILFHEARHSEYEARYWLHVACPDIKDANGQPLHSIFSGLPLAGEMACDNTALGAYGTSAMMVKNISRFCQNCSEKVKMDGDLYFQDQIHRLVSEKDQAQLLKDASEVAP